jgi:hypothetical protein
MKPAFMPPHKEKISEIQRVRKVEKLLYDKKNFNNPRILKCY